LHNSEESCARLEARLVRKAQWRGEAERQIREMLVCGEGLQREQVDLRRQLEESRRHDQERGEHIESLRSALEREEQVSDILKARLWVIEGDNAELTNQAEQERGCHQEDAARLQSQLFTAQQEHAGLTAELLTARGVDQASEAVEAARRDLLAVLSRERTRWAKAHGDLGRRLADTQDALERARSQEKAEAAASAEANASLSAALRTQEEALRASRRVAKGLELRSEQSHALQGGLDRESRTSLATKTLVSCSSDLSPPRSQVSSPRSPRPKVVVPGRSTVLAVPSLP